MNKTVVTLLEENNRLLKELISLMSSNKQSKIQEGNLFDMSPEIIKSLGKQYIENPEILIQPDAVAQVKDGNLFISSSKGRVNANVIEKTVKSSFINSISQRGNRLYVVFKSGKTYQYTSDNQREFNRVADILLTAHRVSRPFLNELRDNPSFDYITL